MTSYARSSRTDGLAIFATATLCLGLATTLALDRVGAPDRLVRAIGPIIVFVGVALFGVGARNADLAGFLTARRSLPPFYGALNIASVAAGLLLCLDPELALAADPAWFAAAAGPPLSVMGFGPLLRRFGATSVADVVATRFPRSPVRAVSALAIWTTSALTALAGYLNAVAATEALATPDRAWAETIVAVVLALSVVPGGLAGVVWCGAASAGAVAAVVILGHTLGWEGVAAAAPTAPAGAQVFSVDSLATVVAVPIAIGVFFAFDSTAIASRNAREAIRAGLGGALICLALAIATISSASPFHISALVGPNPVRAALVGAAAVAGALALARVGVHASCRAMGVALADPPRPFPALASVRLARMRAAQLALIVGCAAFDRAGILDARTALILGMALSLAAVAPVAALAALPRVGSFAMGVAILAACAMALVRAGAILDRKSVV